MSNKRALNVAAVVSVGLLLLAPGRAAAQSEWLTWGHDQERTGWNPSEKTLTRDNVSRLELKWKSQLATSPNAWFSQR